MVLIPLIVFLQIFLNHDYHFVESSTDFNTNFQSCFPYCDENSPKPHSIPRSTTNEPTSRTPRAASGGASLFSTNSMPFESDSAIKSNVDPFEKKLLQHLQPNMIGRNRFYDDLNHDNATLCTRNCTKHPDPRTCYYIFNVENYHAMGIACQDCAENTADCFRKQCIPADGIERQVQTINRMIPGPAIDVCRGDRIIVDVINKIPAEELTIHWHGVYQKGTPWMDGVPFVTQCPIASNSKFRYDFHALTNGTLFYHSHIGASHANGVYGSLTVRIPEEDDPNTQFHKYDLPSHNIIIADWNHSPFNTYFPGYFKDKSKPTKPESYIINGLGRHMGTKTPLAEFHVDHGESYRFRIIGGTTSTCPFKVAIENHPLKVVALDGFPCAPIDVDALVMVGGQRTDVVIEADKAKNSVHRIIVEGMDGCANITQAAILLYDDAGTPTEPFKTPLVEELYTNPKYLNNHQISCSDENINACSDSISAPPRYKATRAQKKLMDEKVDITIELHTSNARLAVEQLTEEYENFHIPYGDNAFASTLNNVTGLFPPVPVLTQRKDIPHDFPMCSPGCEKQSPQLRRCLCLIFIPLNSVVDVVFNEVEGHKGGLHPIHVHGHHFTVIPVKKTVKTSFSSRSGSRGGVDTGLIQRDTVFVPLDGQTTIRFRADNPGYWLMHCHYHMHAEGGMFLVFQVGTEEEIPKPPKDFPKCGYYLPSVNDL